MRDPHLWDDIPQAAPEPPHPHFPPDPPFPPGAPPPPGMGLRMPPIPGGGPGMGGLPGAPPMGWEGGAPRVRRGDVRAALLSLLSEGPKNGYQMIQDIEERSRGVWRPSPGSVYPSLQQLEDEALVASDESGGSRIYSLTEQGREQAERHLDGEPPWDEVARSVPEDRHELRLLWAQLNEAFSHLARTANDQQVAQAKKLLRQTRKSVFQILAED
ncbi:PadR family transcriptional regulator [Nonomuraea sp. NPDC049141]|uniref:PadR family transcriptional regulator n=1 Tax=Nonomuraea sp. NPDC049141 TaxID=3155500 RepID=UPI0033DE10FB